MARGTSSSYGNVKATHMGMADLTPSTRPTCTLQVQVTSYRWTSPPDLQGEFHPDFSIDLHGYAGSDGMRRFLPADGVDSFIDRAFWAGLAMLTRDRQLSWEHASVYRTMKLIFERVRCMKEHLDREFSYSRDLFIRQLGRETNAERSVLPSDLGKTATGAGRSWNSKILCNEGRARARELGIEQRTSRVAISYGLLVAAERNPSDIEDSEVAPLVRLALFAPAEEDEVLSDDCIDEVYGRLTDLLNDHRHDAEEDFQRWYAGPNSNLFKAIAKKDMSVSVVRKALLQRGWQAYEYVAYCVSYFIQAFVRSLPASLRADERELLAHMYQPQPYLGGLPMIFLLERHQFIAPIIGRLWESPGDSQMIRVLHRLLHYYGEMAPSRRKADVKSKRAQNQIEVANSDITESQAVAVEGGRMDQILDRIVERHQLCCDQCERPPECAIGDSQQLKTTDNRWAAVEYWCQDHGNRRQIEVPLAELTSIAEELGIKEPD